MQLKLDRDFSIQLPHGEEGIGELKPSSYERLFLLYNIHKSLNDLVDLEAVARDFTSTNSRQINYFGHF